jgi:signal transduction histidine kinase/CheY-like chemotaxis protein
MSAEHVNPQHRRLDFYHGEKQFRRLLDALPAGAYLCDARGLIIYYNEHAVQLWGRAPKIRDPIDRFCGSFKLFTADGMPIKHDQCWMALALEHEREYNGLEIIIERPDGVRITCLAHASPIHDDAGRMLGAMNVLVDITDRKRAEIALKEADRAKNEFLATLSHELRNPLAPIHNALSILRIKGTNEPEGQRALDLIDRQMRQLTHLVNDLLDIGRITENKLTLRTELLNIEDIIQAAAEMSRPLLEDGRHAFDISMPREAVFVDGDVHRLTQAVSNLLNNAATFTPRGGHIALRADRQDGEVVLTVHDDGIGIGSDKLAGIFDIFIQADHSPDRAHAGLGVGLPLAKRITEMHGGSVEAYSDGPGAGSTFTIRLPVSVPNTQPAPEESPEAVPIAEARMSRILVVDDSPDVVESMSLLLQLMEIDVRTASGGQEAITVADGYRPDVILLDIGMPGMNGLEAAREIRRRPWGGDIKLIAVTGWGQESDIRRSREAGFDDHLVKPMDPDALMQLIGSLDAHASSRNRVA